MRDERKIPPIVSDADRQWAIEQKPAWWDAKAAERAKRLKLRRPLAWESHVADQAERFERHSEHVIDRKTPAEWSGLWRRVWWPKADPHVRFPDSAPYEHDGEVHPFWRRGDPMFDRAMAVATRAERLIGERFGVIQFRPDDPRLARLAEDAR